MNEKTVCCILVIFLIICLFSIMVAGCKSTQTTGADELVELRVELAVRAERDRWVAQLHSEVTEYISEGLREIDAGVGNISSGIEAVRVAGEEYRRLFLSTLERLQQLETEVSEANNNTDSNMRDTSTTGD